jgi:hypothetical protein
LQVQHALDNDAQTDRQNDQDRIHEEATILNETDGSGHQSGVGNGRSGGGIKGNGRRHQGVLQTGLLLSLQHPHDAAGEMAMVFLSEFMPSCICLAS